MSYFDGLCERAITCQGPERPEPTVAITIRVPVSQADRIGRAALSMGLTRSSLFRDLALAGEEVLIQKIGLQRWQKLHGVNPDLEPFRCEIHEQEEIDADLCEGCEVSGVDGAVEHAVEFGGA